MEFFSKVFTWFANLSSKLPVINFRAYFITVLVAILTAGIIVALTYFGSRAFKLSAACKKIINYLNKVDTIDDENLADFINQCITSKIPTSLRNAWLEYLNVRFGFPSDIVSDKNVYQKEIKNVKEIRPTIFLSVGLLLLAIFAFWGFGTLNSIDMSVIHFFGLLLVGVIYLLFVLLSKKVEKDTYEVFYKMQEELDVKVDLQVEKNYATDSSPLSELAAMVDEIIARNTAKIVDLQEEMNAKDDQSQKNAVEHQETPIETLIAIEEAIENNEPEMPVNIDEMIPLKPGFDAKEIVNVDAQIIENEAISSSEEKEKIKVEEVQQPIEEQIDIIEDNKPLQEEIKEEIIQTDNVDENIEKTQLIDELVDPLAMYQDFLPVEDKSSEKIAPKSGLRIGKKVGLSSLDVEDVLMGSDFSEVEGEEEDEEDIEPLQETVVKATPKNKTTKKSNTKKKDKK